MVSEAYDLFIGVYRIEVRGSMGANTPQKFSAAKLFGFGGDSKKVPDPPSPTPPAPDQPSAFASSFSTQAIKMENKFDSFKGIQSSSEDNNEKRLRSFDEEPVIATNWAPPDDDDDDDNVFNDSDDDDDDPFPETDPNVNNTKVVGFNDKF